MTEKLLAECRGEVYRYSKEEFRLSSGALSHHYFNCRKITLHPVRLQLLAEIIRDELLPDIYGKELPLAAGGLTLGADPIAVSLSLSLLNHEKQLFPLIVRKTAKGHGLGRRIEGEYDGIDEVLALDDVVTTGSSTLEAVEAFRQVGLTVRHAICVVDREEGGAELLQNNGVKLYSVFKKRDFISEQERM